MIFQIEPGSLKLDISAEEAFERISRARGMHVPDTEEQAAWVVRLPIE